MFQRCSVALFRSTLCGDVNCCDALHSSGGSLPLFARREEPHYIVAQPPNLSSAPSHVIVFQGTSPWTSSRTPALSSASTLRHLKSRRLTSAGPWTSTRTAKSISTSSWRPSGSWTWGEATWTAVTRTLPMRKTFHQRMGLTDRRATRRGAGWCCAAIPNEYWDND